MRTRTTAILVVLGAVVLALGISYGTGPREPAQPSAGGTLAFPGLTPALADAAQVEIAHQGVTLRLTRTGTDAASPWGVAERGGYPAQQAKVHELLTALTELRLDEPRTSDPAQYARLGVEDATGKRTDSTLVRVLDGKGAMIAALIVGHARSAQGGGTESVYVRRPGEAQAWLADGHVAASTGVQDWLDRDIVNIDAAKIAGVAATRGDTTLTFARTGDRLALTDPADHPKLDDFKLEAIGRALADLTFEDVKPAPPPGNPVGHAVFTTTDGMTVTVEVNKSGPEVWATFAATGNAGAAALAAKVKGWAYALGGWKESALLPTLDDLKAAEPPAPAPSPTTPSPTTLPPTTLPAPTTPAPTTPPPAGK